MDFLSPESTVRLWVFMVMAVALVLCELAFPRRTQSRRLLRWPGNFGIFLTNAVMLALLPISAVAAAVFSIQYKFGLFYWFEIAFWPKVVATIVILDLVIYFQHRLLHMVPCLWRVHRMHHTDPEFDFTTALRFHPIEIFLSILIKAVAIVLIGAPVFAVIVFEIILNGSAMFNHSNLKLPGLVDRFVRLVLVTPDMHRVHHSILSREHNMNYGFALSLWDRIFGSYRAQPSGSHEAMEIGLPEFRDERESRIDWLVTHPFRSPPKKS